MEDNANRLGAVNDTWESRLRYILCVLLIFCELFLWPLWLPNQEYTKGSHFYVAEWTFVCVVKQLFGSYKINHPLLLHSSLIFAKSAKDQHCARYAPLFGTC